MTAAAIPSDRAALLAAIRRDPDSDTPRLVYADLLDDAGESDRAEFIRVQCALARIGDTCRCDHEVGVFSCEWCDERVPLRRRERELLAAKLLGLPIWFPGNTATPTARRGFIEELSGVGEDDWFANAAAILAGPDVVLRRVRLTSPPELIRSWTDPTRFKVLIAHGWRTPPADLAEAVGGFGLPDFGGGRTPAGRAEDIGRLTAWLLADEFRGVEFSWPGHGDA